MAALADSLKAICGIAILSAKRSKIQRSWGVPRDAQLIAFGRTSCELLGYLRDGNVGRRIMAVTVQLACHQEGCEQRPQIGGFAPGRLDPNPQGVWT